LLESISLSAATWLQAWDAHSFHRTGTSGDEAGAAWVASEATTLGAQVTSETFGFERVDPQQTFLELDGTCIEAVPVFDAPPTDATGISGTIGLVGGDTAIGVVALSPQLGVSGEYERLRRGANHRALVIVTRGALPGLALVNADQFNAPHGAPALQVSSDAHDAVFAANAARLVADYHRTPASARNVVVTIAGRDRNRPPVVVMTPRSYLDASQLLGSRSIATTKPFASTCVPSSATLASPLEHINNFLSIIAAKRASRSRNLVGSDVQAAFGVILIGT
jgi:hypothetical protein